MKKKSKNTNYFSIFFDIGYIIFRDKAARILPKSKWIRSKLDSAGIKVSYLVYMSALLFWAIAVPILIYVLIPYIIDLSSINLIFSGLLDSPSIFIDPQIIRLALSLIGLALTITIFYTYPLYISGKVKREIERNLVYITSYMSIMESGGATSEETFLSLAKMGKMFGIQQSGESVIRSVELLGQDIMTAIDKESKRTPSKDYGTFLQGFVSTVHKGGDLRAYLRFMSDKHIEDRKRLLNKLITQLNFMAEVFIIALVAFPTIMIVLLTVMESLGGNVLGDLSGMQIMNLMTYAIIPFAAIGMLFLIDMTMENE